MYFSYPRAQEDAAAARCSALAIIDGIQGPRRGSSASAASRSPCASASLGSGVVGDVGGKTKREQLVIGNTPNVAARLQGLAEPTPSSSAPSRTCSRATISCASRSARNR
ncbi:MAG: hypothetical protein R3B70_43700 [Polyangiaceae bacterium]